MMWLWRFLARFSSKEKREETWTRMSGHVLLERS